MILFSIVLDVLKFIHIISYSIELGFVSFILLYKLSRKFMDFSRPIVIHLDLLCLYLSNFTNLLNVRLFLANYFMYNIVT